MTSLTEKSRPVSLAEGGLRHVGLKVSNVERSREFYSEILGLTTASKKPGYAHIPLGPDLLILDEKEAVTSNFHFGFRLKTASEVDEWKKWLSRKGIHIYEDIAEKDHPRSFKIKDPDGYLIEISSESEVGTPTKA